MNKDKLEPFLHKTSKVVKNVLGLCGCMYAMLWYNTAIHIYYRVTLGGSIELTGLSHTSWFLSLSFQKHIAND